MSVVVRDQMQPGEVIGYVNLPNRTSPGPVIPPCRHCEGRGWFRYYYRDGDYIEEDCEHCNGTGFQQ